MNTDVLSVVEAMPPEARLDFFAHVAPLIEKAEQAQTLELYQCEPELYITTYLGWTPWGTEATGQRQVVHKYKVAIASQLERNALEDGLEPLWYVCLRCSFESLRGYSECPNCHSTTVVVEAETKYYEEGEQLKNWVIVDSGHNIGKTKLLAGLTSHFFDCLRPSITYCFAPAWDQVNYLLFKEIRADRRDTTLPGQVLESPRIKYLEDHFVRAKATNSRGGLGREKTHGQHSEYLMFVIDEAEGVDKMVFDSVRSMGSGGSVVVNIVARNPRTTICEAHHMRGRPYTEAITVSCFDHPNVIEGRNVIPGAVRRDYIVDMLEYCEIAEEHSLEDSTFELPWDPGVIYLPGLEFKWRVLGIASENIADDVFLTFARYDAAIERGKQERFKPVSEVVRLGCDMARFGSDRGTLYVYQDDWLWRAARFAQDDNIKYYTEVKKQLRLAIERGAINAQIRIDAGGGYGGGLEDLLKHDAELLDRRNDPKNPYYPLEEFSVVMVHFNGAVIKENRKRFSDKTTEMIESISRRFKTAKLRNPASELRVDLCERPYEWVFKAMGKNMVEIRRVSGKSAIRSTYNRSTDDGDGAMLAMAEDKLFPKKSKVKFT